MANNRTVLFGKTLLGTEYLAGGAGRGAAGLETDIVIFRDAMRAAFPSPRYLVSDITRWTATGDASLRGYAFLFRDTTFGHEWAFVQRAHLTSQYYNYIYTALGGSGTNLGNRMKTINTSAIYNPSTEADMRPICIYNYNYSLGSFNMGFTGPNLTYTLGDFQAPASNPSTSLATLDAWLPGAGLTPHQPSMYAGSWGGSSIGDRWAIMYDSDIGFLRQYYSYGCDPAEHASIFSGILFRSYADGGLSSPTDPYRHGYVCLQTSGMSSGSLGSAISSNVLRTFFTRESGAVETMGASQSISPALTRASAYDASGGYRQRPIEISSSGFVKGYLDDRIITEAFARNDGIHWMKRLQHPDADNIMIKDHYLYVSAWAKDTPTPGMIPDPGIILV